LTICNSELTLTGARETRAPTCDSPLHTACVNHRPWRARWICGRKKLPFAGYSVVKESVKPEAASLRCRPWSPPVAASLSPNLAEVSGASPLDQPSYPMDPLASLQAEPLKIPVCQSTFATARLRWTTSD